MKNLKKLSRENLRLVSGGFAAAVWMAVDQVNVVQKVFAEWT